MLFTSPMNKKYQKLKSITNDKRASTWKLGENEGEKSERKKGASVEQVEKKGFVGI